MATYQLSPLSVGEILDGALAIYRRHFGTLVAIAAICQGPWAVLSIYVQLGGGFFVHPWLGLTTYLLGGIGGLLAAGATLRVISEAYLGHEPDLGGALRLAVRKMWPLFVAGFARALLVSLAMILLIVPGIIVLCGYAVTSQVVVLEEPRRPTDALGRSWFLTKGSKRKVLQLGVVVFLLASLPSFVAGMVSALAPEYVVAMTVLGNLLSLLLTPIVACGLTLLYYDLRVRKEAFDLQLLSEQIGIGALGA